ncbi:DivIVA domain-containing protein [Corynebacterium suicordis]|uniref:DivIVA domain-containing protein n=1 Tax=Corynebacterium suicordis DSM 45110 TaxID=1121369 RepID=A0ABR9ZIX0_9CORY|nr:DivIVA domain-containing protein [Corynebacterium suicordis]MBF4553375.1 DivIVA domain-containing protein [Corynebacterium suicordis DSM 45110]MDR6277650.1 cell division septum initiation protein DivIVA [Corynebacterium suicordis]
MYKTFQGMDDLQQMVEQAYGVPMTANCMVPRREVLDILDEMRNAIPIELDDAQDVLDHRDNIIADSQAQANNLVADAEDEQDRILREAQARANDLVQDAEDRAASTVAHAEAEADRLVSDARREYEQVTERAAAEADRLINSGNESYQRSVDEGIAEQQRLISESEVVRNAEAEAQRIIESAHADSDRLRTECDRYVDSTLAEFESSLTDTLRVVNRDRAALRKGAGAAGYRPQH